MGSQSRKTKQNTCISAPDCYLYFAKIVFLDDKSTLVNNS